MAATGNIESIKNGHSVKEAVVFFSVTPCISEPKSYKALILDGGGLFGKFQRYEPIKNISVSFNQKTEETAIEQSQDSGFKLLSYANGELSFLAQGINQFDKGVFTFNMLKYESWTLFMNQVVEAAKEIAKFRSNYLVKSFGLLYIDEFRAINPSEFNISQIFNLESDFVPRTLSNSNLLDYNLNFSKEEGDRQWAENLMVNIDNNQKIISIYNNVSFAILPVKFQDMVEHEELEDALNFAHGENKKLLKDLLNQEISKMIGL